MSFLTRLFKRKRKLYAFEPDYCVRPSESIKENMKAAGVDELDLYLASPFINVTAFKNMLNDSVPISKSMAIKLSSILGSEPAFWVNLSKNYHDKKGGKDA